MRVAVCFSGHMRTFEKTAASFKRHLSDLHDTSIFIHTWDNYSSGRGDVATNHKVDRSRIEAAYAPKTLIIEPQRQLAFKDHPTLHTTPNPPFNVLSKWFSSKQSYDSCVEWSKQNAVEFDVIVSCRSDMLFHEDVILDPEKGVVFTPGGNGSPPGTLHDYFAFGDHGAMAKYFGVYESFDSIVADLNVSRFRAEEVITHHLVFNRVPLKYCYIEYSLCRLSGEVRRMKA